MNKMFIVIISLIPTLLFAAPLNPSNLVLQALSTTSVSLSWQDNSDDETGFKIYRDDELIMLTNSDTNNFIDIGLTPNETYTYTVKATDDIIQIKVSQELFAPYETISVNLTDLPANNGDWVGIYPKGSSHDWENVLSWSFTNGTKYMDEAGIVEGTLALDGVGEGEYEARLFYNNSFDLESSRSFVVTNDDGKVKIFVIGDSTVHNDEEGGMGWGSQLSSLVDANVIVINQARSGASSKSYKVDSASHHDWTTTKTLMSEADIRHGAYLFIQFGHNDEKNIESLHTEPGVGGTFYTHLKEYVDEARVLGIVPVLITPVSRLWKYDNSHGDYPQTTEDLAADEDVLLLDLKDKSWNIFNTYESHDAVVEAFGYKDHTHFDPEGASMVAVWIKELVCSSEDETLCSFFQ